MSTVVRFSALCSHGTRLQSEVDRDLGRRRKVAHLMAQADEQGDLPTFTKYQHELDDLKQRIENQRQMLNAHVGHCGDGCARDKRQGLGNSAFEHHRAPSNNKPPLPRMAEIAARLREGEAVEAIASEYDRHATTLRLKLNAAGFHSTSGRPVERPTRRPIARPALVLDETWREEALCAQTDPEAFFPEQGGTTRPAKAVCAACSVAVQCLDYALEQNERFGIWGGLNERSRRKLTRATDPDQAAS